MTMFITVQKNNLERLASRMECKYQFKEQFSYQNTSNKPLVNISCYCNPSLVQVTIYGRVPTYNFSSKVSLMC